VPHNAAQPIQTVSLLNNDVVTPLFMAAIEATEEAIINSLFTATSTTGFKGHAAEVLPKDKVLSILKKYNRLR
jgi:D-aminopeptidase